jgi:hypothetical protein
MKCDTMVWGGCVASTIEELVAGAVHLYKNKQAWQDAQEAGLRLVGELFNEETNCEVLVRALKDARTRHLREGDDILCALLWHHRHRATEYLSRWIASRHQLPADQ